MYECHNYEHGMVICLGRGADLHMAQLMPPPLTVSCFSKIQIGFTFLVPAHLVVTVLKFPTKQVRWKITQSCDGIFTQESVPKITGIRQLHVLLKLSLKAGWYTFLQHSVDMPRHYTVND